MAMRVAATKAARTIGPGTKRRSNIASPARARNFQPQLLQFCVLFGKRQLRRWQAPYGLGSRFRVGRITFVLRCRHVRPIFPHSPISHAPVAYGRWLGCFLCSFDNVVVKVSMVRAFRNAEARRSGMSACASTPHMHVSFHAIDWRAGKEREVIQALNSTRADRKRRAAIPMPRKPKSSMAQVDASGTAATVDVAKLSAPI